MARATTALLLPDGVGVRNFLIGEPARVLAEQRELLLLHVLGEDSVARYTAEIDGRIRTEQLLSYRESAPAALLRYALMDAQMHYASTQAMRHNLRQPIRGSWRTRSMRQIARVLGRAAAWPAGLRILDALHCRQVNSVGETEHYRRLFADLRPDVLFCSHQRPPNVLPPVLAARSLGIPTATFIFSWDNITSKGRIAAPFDHFLVWSELMRDELLRYYPDVTPERVHVVGTPQFDPYADPRLLWSRDEFFARVGADPGRPLICYSGGDAGTCPEDAEHVRVLMELIRDGRVAGNPQVLVRPAPVDPGERYAAVRRDFPELLYAKPAWQHLVPGDWSRVVTLPEDVVFLANLTYHADLNVNLASTMTLDFALRDKPVVNVAFDVADPPPFGVPLWEYYYQFEHYRTVVDCAAARFARSVDELADYVNAYLADPSLDRDGRRKLVELEVSGPIGSASARIAAALDAIAAAPQAQRVRSTRTGRKRTA